MTASLRLSSHASRADSLDSRPDLSAGQLGLVWGLVLAAHAGGAVWLWRTLSEPAALPEPPTIAVVMLDSEVPAPPAPPAPPKPSTEAPQPHPQPTPAVSHSASVRAPSVLSAPAPTALPMTSAPPAPTAPADTPVPAPAATPSPSPAAAPAPVAPAAPKTLPSSAVAYLVKPVPVYPRASRDLGETGTVLLRVLVDEQGRPREVELSKSSGHPRLDRAAVQAMRAARFQPHIEDGQPRMVWVPAPIHFQLDEL